MIPGVRIEIEYMRERIIHALALREEKLNEALKKSVGDAIESFNFDYEVRVIVNQVLHEAVRDSVNQFLKYGEGKKVIDSMVARLEDKESA
jgi:hypothetical protein